MSGIDGLVAHGLETGYTRRRGRHVVTRGDVVFEAGAITAVVGANGAGKTTLLRTLAALLPPLAGTVMFDGQPVGDFRRLHGIGYLPEALELPAEWSGRGLIGLAATSARQDSASIARATERAGIDFDLRVPIGRLSKGMQRRLALALALLPMPRLLMLDEPEAGLDPAQRLRLRDRLRTLAAEGRTVVVASHDVTGLCSVADAAWLLCDGRLDPVQPSDFTDSARVMALFQTGGVQ
jgi:ABC-2 type transport system ATP-binding protein